MTQKKNNFWRLVFSLMPGAGEMYMGFMKMGLSLMGMFFIIIAVASFLRFDVLIFIAFVIWFYSFFHVHNLAGMPDEEFYAVEDVYLISVDKIFYSKENIQEFPKRTIGIILIVIGVYMTARGILSAVMQWLPDAIAIILHDIIYRIPQVFTGIGIVALGVYMIRGKKKELNEWERSRQEEIRQLGVEEGQQAE